VNCFSASLIYNWCFLAMPHRRLAHADEARQWLAKPVQGIEQAEKKATDPARGKPMPWNCRLTLPLLRREAEELLGSRAAEAQK
jgi:hypothetical protein